MSRQGSHDSFRNRSRAASNRPAKRRATTNHLSFHRRLRFEPLEDRHLLATITVTTLTDGIGVPGTSLREAIAAANANDTINFSVTGAINLTNLGQLTVDKNLIIDGPGAALLTINAFDPTPATNNADGSRVFSITNSNASLLNVTIRDVILNGGDASASGGGIANWENLTLISSAVTGNAAVNGLGGGIYTYGGTLSVTDCTVSGNTAIFGGGIRNSGGGAVFVTDSQIFLNSATDDGGGIQSNLGSVTVTRSTISGNQAVSDAGGLQGGNATLNVTGSTISANTAGGNGGGINLFQGSLTIANSFIGHIASGGPENNYATNGGAIYNESGTVSVTNSRITGNRATGSAGGILNRLGTLSITNSTMEVNYSELYGGHIWNYDGTVTLTGSTLDASAAQSGGAILNTYGNVSITTSTISDGRATTNGGGVWNYFGNLTVTRSTIVGSNAESGAGIYNQTLLSDASQGTTIETSTISDNLGTTGGGVMNASGKTVIRHSTITTNQNWRGTGGPAAGVGSQAGAGTLTQIYSSIIAGNNPSPDLPNDDVVTVGAGASSFQSLGYNVIGVGTAAAGFLSAGDQRFVQDPLLHFLEDNGGPTWTHALLSNSPALDLGDPAIAFNASQFDQRSTGFVRVFNGDGVGGARIDVGAFERQNPGTPQTFVVSTLVDEIDGNFSAGDLSLREAIGLANANLLVSDTISFSSALTGGTIVLTRGDMHIMDPLTINGLGATQLTIDASGSDPTPTLNNGDGSRIFYIVTGGPSPYALPLFAVAINNLTLTGGDTGDGGAIKNFESLTVTGLTITNNAGSEGGGISDDGDLTVMNSTFTGNVASNDGGAIESNGDVTLIDTTLSGNSSDDDGGGIEAFGVTATRTTITGNTATRGGGLSSAVLNVTNSTISGNTAHIGGGIHNSGGGGTSATRSITQSTVSGNTASYGAGIYKSSDGTLSISFSTISGNIAAHTNGGGILVANSALSVFNSTISGNQSGSGGGILSYNATTTISNSTITNNYGSFAGGGLNKFGTGSMTLSNTIVAGNRGVGVARDDIRGAVTAHYSFIGDNTGATITNNGGNQIGTSGAPKNPMLGPLADNLGPTRTHALLPGSMAIDMGDPSYGQFPNTDQRGVPFVRFFNGDGIGNARVDIGAFEVQPAPLPASGDANQDHAVNTADYVLYRKTLGATNVPPYSGADADGDSTIDPGDRAVWLRNFSETLPGAGGGETAAAANPESVGGTIQGDEPGIRGGESSPAIGPLPDVELVAQQAPTNAQAMTTESNTAQRTGKVEPVAALVMADFSTGSSELGAVSRKKMGPRTSNDSANDAAPRDTAFVAWLTSRRYENRRQAEHAFKDLDVDELGEPLSEAICEEFDSAFESLALEAV